MVKDKPTQIEHTQIDIAVLILAPILATMLSLIIEANFLTSTLLFFGVPSLYLSYRAKEKVKKTLTYSLLFSIPLSYIIDYLAILNKSWYVPTTIFPFRLPGEIPIEDMVWGFLLVYFVIIFYEYFLDKGEDKINHKNRKYLALLFSLLVAGLFFFAIFLQEILHIPYFYFFVCVFMIVCSVRILSVSPSLISKVVMTGAYFFVLAIMFELTGIHLNQWIFPGTEFIGYVELFGLKFPFEEFLGWFVLAAIGILAVYEFVDDDRK